MMGLGWQELAIILVIVIVIFGAGKVPEIGWGSVRASAVSRKNPESETTKRRATPSNRAVRKQHPPSPTAALRLKNGWTVKRAPAQTKSSATLTHFCGSLSNNSGRTGMGEAHPGSFFCRYGAKVAL